MSRALARFVKRAFDVVGAVVALLSLFLPMAFVGMLIRQQLGRPLLYVQSRPGLHGRQFRLYKFRTMREAYASDGSPLPDAERLTQLGRFLRATSLDELPEFWNVLRGDMSLVGPRPLLIDYLGLYTPEQARRHDMKPGITGLAQVSGRNALSWERKFELDTWYVDHWSLWLDIKILFLTIVSVIRRHGISHPGHVTGGEKFNGSVPPP